MSKRGLSREEKRLKMLELFHETSEFFTLKELEKILPKQKGIGELNAVTRKLTSVQQSVKEILDELVSEDLVSFDKIGTSNYFWAFPSAAGAAKQAALDKATGEAQTLKSSLKDLQAAIKSASKGREDTSERRQLLAELEARRAESTTLQAELEAYGAADPVRYERKKEAIGTAKASAVRWTYNTMILWDMVKSVSPEFDDGQFRQMLGISETWEDLEVESKQTCR